MSRITRSVLCAVLVLGLAVPVLACANPYATDRPGIKESTVESALDKSKVGYKEVKLLGGNAGESHRVMAAMILQSNGYDPELATADDYAITEVTLDNGETVTGVYVGPKKEVIFYKNP